MYNLHEDARMHDDIKLIRGLIDHFSLSCIICGSAGPPRPPSADRRLLPLVCTLTVCTVPNNGDYSTKTANIISYFKYLKYSNNKLPYGQKGFFLGFSF